MYAAHMMRPRAAKAGSDGRFTITPESRARRFLVLGCEGGTYYATEPQLTRENAAAVLEWATESPDMAAAAIVDGIADGAFPRLNAPLFALAVLATAEAPGVRRAAWARVRNLKTQSQLMQFVENYKALGGKWGRTARTGLAAWYVNRPTRLLAYQMLKYQNRNGWTTRDLLRMGHPVPRPGTGQADLFAWAAGSVNYLGEVADPGAQELLDLVEAAKHAGNAASVAGLIRASGGNLTREMIPSQWLNEPEVAIALMERSPATALIRNLAAFTRCGAITARGSGGDMVVDRLTDAEWMAASRLHPVNVLIAWETYKGGAPVRGRGEGWSPVPRVVDALEEAFYLSFRGLPKIKHPLMLAIDTSGSMQSGTVAGTRLSPAKAGMALAMAFVRAAEPGHVAVFGVDSRIWPIPIHQDTKLDDAVSAGVFGGGSTDLSAVTELARKVAKQVGPQLVAPQGFMTITDSETNAHRVNPAESLRRYRYEVDAPEAGHVVVGMTASQCSIADPADPRMLDVVGFDTSAGPLIQDFLGGGAGAPDSSDASDE